MGGRVVRVRERPQVDLVVLAVLAGGPHSAVEMRRAVGEDAPPVAVPATRIVPTLHRLARNRLIARQRTTRRYVLTETGRRVLAARTGEAERYAEAVRALAGPG